LLLFIG
ncbi:hypothetical protein D031_4726B, partial [Vibrio parahaemolyticus VP-48]